MKTNIVNYSSTAKSSKNIVQADGFQIKGVGSIGPTGNDKTETKIINFASTTKDAKNIIEADGFQIKGVGMIGVSSPPSIQKHPYVAKQRIKDDMTDSQKNGVAIWNSMIDKLQEADLMESKK